MLAAGLPASADGATFHPSSHDACMQSASAALQPLLFSIFCNPIHILFNGIARALGCDVQCPRRLRSSVFLSHTASLIDAHRQQNKHVRALLQATHREL